jgi:hypothetical protein
VIDTTMGWEFQWQRVDAIAGRLPEVSLLPVILRCPRHVAIERITHRHHDSGGKRATSAEISTSHSHVFDYLERLDRPDLHVVDATHEPDLVYAETLRYLHDRLPAAVACSDPASTASE